MSVGSPRNPGFLRNDMAQSHLPSFVISLDFELFWGVRDKRTIRDYGENILGVRQAIPAMLALFRAYRVHATWAAVGLLLFDTKKDLLDHLPTCRPAYANRSLDPYLELGQLGTSEATDPYHYGLSLARQIAEIEGMEIGTHTFSHYYCLEKGQDETSFRADLAAAITATQRLGTRPRSLVFPRNQFNPQYLRACREMGIACFRGNERNWIYRGTSEDEVSRARRMFRLTDAYLNLSGHNGFKPNRVEGMIDVPSSRFLRPFAPRLRRLEGIRLHRIKAAMTRAARQGDGFHLWWHPHNFGACLEHNLANLKTILEHFARLRERYGMEAQNMGEYADRHRGSA
jgi:peptidoglycan/xylan/chitin deacetylase (PgdA/CDA1 family)